MGTLSLNDYEDVSIWVPWGHISGRWYGNRKYRPILAIHGWMDNLGTFDKLIPLLPDYLGVLCIDLPGFGLSSRLPPGIHYTFVEWSFVIARIMKELKWSKVSLMGHSVGGIMGFLHTCLAPHTVDFVITIEGVLNPIGKIVDLSTNAFNIDAYLKEEERNTRGSLYEPISYTLEHLCNFVQESTLDSVSASVAQHILNRTMHRSQLYPDKVFVLKDNRTKYCNEFLMTAELGVEMARRIKQIPYLILKGSDSYFITEKDKEVISVIADQNPHFEYYEVSGKHHVHLSNAEECAKYIVPFLRRHRPPPEEEKELKIKHKL